MDVTSAGGWRLEAGGLSGWRAKCVFAATGLTAGVPMPPTPPAASLQPVSHVYRANAVTLPASTLMMFPVDFADRSDAKNSTASATSSGTTLRFRRLRLR